MIIDKQSQKTLHHTQQQEKHKSHTHATTFFDTRNSKNEKSKQKEAAKKIVYNNKLSVMSGTYRNKSSNASWCSSSPAPWGSTRSWWGFRAPPSVCCRWWTRCTNYSHPARTSALAFRIFYRWFCRRWSSRVESGSTVAARCVAFRFRRWLCDGRKEEREKKKRKSQMRKCCDQFVFCYLFYLLFRTLRKKSSDACRRSRTNGDGRERKTTH